MNIFPSRTALAISLTQPFSAVGGTPPYTFKILPGGAGGSVDGSGIYTAPSVTGQDVIEVTDSLGATATALALVKTPLNLFCDVLQQSMGLADGRVYLWDQKIFEPTDMGLYIVVSVLNPKVFGSSRYLDADGNAVQSVNMHTSLSVDIKSRGPEARDRKEEVIMALNSMYSEQQQEKNSIRIFALPQSFNNLSEEDGAAIPYRFNFTVNIQYFVTKKTSVDFYDSFSQSVETDT